MRDTYEMDAHHTYDSPQSKVLTDDVVDTFAIAGPPGLCIERLRELAGLGLSRFIFVGYSFDMDPDEARAARRRIAEEIVPAFR